MKEIDKQEIQKIEQQLGIYFVEPDSFLLTSLDHQIEHLAKTLESPIYCPVLPDKGFLSSPLTFDQEKEINQLLGPAYARAAVELQDKLTNISIQENNERMVFLPSIFQEEKVDLSLSTLPFHEACEEWAGKPRVFWAREGVAIRILRAGEALASIGHMIHIEDAFRPTGVQESLFFRRIKMILQEHPDWSEQWDKVWMEARSKTAICPGMAGHKSGAAADLTLRTLEGEPLPLGSIYPEGGAKVALDYPYITQKEWSTRQLFKAAMEMAGLGIYPYENWHASFGDLSDGIAISPNIDVKPNYQAIYGPIKGFDDQTGEIEPYQKEEYFAPFFSKEQFIQSTI